MSEETQNDNNHNENDYNDDHHNENDVFEEVTPEVAKASEAAELAAEEDRESLGDDYDADSDDFAKDHEEAVKATEAAAKSAESDSSDSAADSESTNDSAESEASASAQDADEDAAYRMRLREFTKELKKQPGQWYIIQCYSGYENKVKTNLDMRIQTLEVEDSIFDVVVPIENVVEKKDGKKKIVKKKLLPGYVLVRMEINDRAWSVVRDTPGVTSFVGNEGNATVVKTREVAKFLLPKTTEARDETQHMQMKSRPLLRKNLQHPASTTTTRLAKLSRSCPVRWPRFRRRFPRSIQKPARCRHWCLSLAARLRLSSPRIR